jgi:hypothetical protein
MNAEFSAHRLDGDLFLKLLIDLAIFRDGAAAMGTAVGQRRFEDFVNQVVGRDGTMSMLAIGSTAGPSGGLGILLGIAFGEWRRLPLIGALRLFELSLETNAFDLKTSIALLQYGDSPIALHASRADRSVHTVSVAKPAVRSCAAFVQVQGFHLGGRYTSTNKLYARGLRDIKGSGRKVTEVASVSVDLCNFWSVSALSDKI